MKFYASKIGECNDYRKINEKSVDEQMLINVCFDGCGQRHRDNNYMSQIVQAFHKSTPNVHLIQFFHFSNMINA